MRKPLLTASLCALGVAGAAAGPAGAAMTADQAWGAPPAKMQIFDADGLARVIDCPTPQAAPECGGNQAAFDALDRDIQAPHGTPTDVIGAYRALNSKGQWYMWASNNDASQALVQRIDATGAPGAVATWGWPDGSAGASAASKGKAHAKKPAKRPAPKHHRKGRKH
jgi:hypothetical protein